MICAIRRNGGLRVVDVTTSFPDKLQADAKAHLSAFKDPESGESHMVSYLADEIRLGHEDQAWAQVKRAYGHRRDSFADFASFKRYAAKWLRDQGFSGGRI